MNNLTNSADLNLDLAMAQLKRLTADMSIKAYRFDFNYGDNVGNELSIDEFYANFLNFKNKLKHIPLAGYVFALEEDDIGYHIHMVAYMSSGNETSNETLARLLEAQWEQSTNNAGYVYNPLLSGIQSTGKHNDIITSGIITKANKTRMDKVINYLKYITTESTDSVSSIQSFYLG